MDIETERHSIAVIGSRLDKPLVVSVVLIFGLGLLVLVSATDFNSTMVLKQLLAITAGIMVSSVLMQRSLDSIRPYIKYVYWAIVIALVLVFVPGIAAPVKGSARWLDLGPFNVQPSELAKPILILAVASYLSHNEGGMADTWGVAFPAFLVASPIIALVLLEPDFGTTIMLTALVGVMTFVAGLRKRVVSMLFSLMVILGSIYVYFDAVRWRRIEAFLDPWSDPSDKGFNVIQVMSSFASGGFLGQGMGDGHMPLSGGHTDYIGAVIGEEWGAVGWVVLMTLYGILLWRCWAVAMKPGDLFPMSVAVGCAALLSGHVVINTFGLLGLAPSTGVVLPFLSFGPTAIFGHTVVVAMILRVGVESEKHL